MVVVVVDNTDIRNIPSSGTLSSSNVLIVVVSSAATLVVVSLLGRSSP